MRLGDLDYAQKQLTIAEVECGKNFQTDCNHVRDFLNALPTIDAVQVVRCKDCKHRVDWHEDGYAEDAGMCIATINHLVAPNHFCSYGERKDGD